MKIDKVKILTIMVILLFIINVVTIAGTWRIIDPQTMRLITPPPNTKDYIINKLGLDERQQEVFEELRTEHFEEMRELQHQIHKEKKSMFDLLKSASPDTAITYAHLAQIMQYEERLERITFEHFRKVRAICNDEQKQHLDAIIAQIMHMMHQGPNQPFMPESGYKSSRQPMMLP